MENHICKKCGSIAGWNPYFQSWICTRCGNEEPKPTTNADRIRTMSNEELVEWLHVITDCDFCPAVEKQTDCSNGKYCRERLHDWLQQEVENGNTT